MIEYLCLCCFFFSRQYSSFELAMFDGFFFFIIRSLLLSQAQIQKGVSSLIIFREVMGVFMSGCLMCLRNCSILK